MVRNFVICCYRMESVRLLKIWALFVNYSGPINKPVNTVFTHILSKLKFCNCKIKFIWEAVTKNFTAVEF